jgi:hypothetical protein
MILPLTITVVACLAVILMTRPTLRRYVDDVPQPQFLVAAAVISTAAALIVGGWSFFVLATIALN